MTETTQNYPIVSLFVSIIVTFIALDFIWNVPL